MTLSESHKKFKKYILVSALLSLLFSALVCVTFITSYDSSLTLFKIGTSVLPMFILGILSAAFTAVMPCTMNKLYLPARLPRSKGVFFKASSVLLAVFSLLSSALMLFSKSERYSEILTAPTEYESTASLALSVAIIALIPSALHFVLTAVGKYSSPLSASFAVALLALAFYNFYDPMIIITSPLRVLTLISYSAAAFSTVQEIKIGVGKASTRLYIASCALAFMLPLSSGMTKLVLILKGDIMVGASLALAGLELFFALYSLSRMLVFFDYDEFCELYKFPKEQAPAVNAQTDCSDTVEGCADALEAPVNAEECGDTDITDSNTEENGDEM